MNPPVIRSILFCLAAFALGLPSAFAQTTARVSVDSAGVQGNDASTYSAISGDGRHVAFMSLASNLVAGDTNGFNDVFVHDRHTGQTSRVSVSSAGAEGNAWVELGSPPSISDDGRFVAFGSGASNFVPGDTNNSHDIFVHDRQSGSTTLVSVSSFGSLANQGAGNSSISGNGRRIAFLSFSSNLVPNDINQASDVFVHDIVTGQTIRASVDSAGVAGNLDSRSPVLSADGQTVAFISRANNLVAGDTNVTEDVFVHELLTGQTTRVSVDSAGLQGIGYSLNPSISRNGRWIAFDSLSTFVSGDTNGTTDAFVHDRLTGLTSRVSVDSAGMQANGYSENPCISSNGRFVGFYSDATNLVPSGVGGMIYCHDRLTGVTCMISVDSSGLPANATNHEPAISSNGQQVSFFSHASNLSSGDTNGLPDVYVHDRGPLGPSLALTGSCPGAVTFTISDATASGSVAILYGPAGVFVKPTPPCQGITLGVAPPTLAAMRSADGSGTATLNFNAPPGACGRSVQAVDVTTCVATNVIVL